MDEQKMKNYQKATKEAGKAQGEFINSSALTI
jgi:hypothetical protein